MPAYTFTVTQEVRTEAEVKIEAANFQQAMAELSRISHEDGIEWRSGPDDAASYTMVRAIIKDGERVPGVCDPAGGDAVGWHGMFGRFDMDDVPEEFLSIKD